MPDALRVIEPVGERGHPPVGPSNPDSRLGRAASPVAQGRDQMERFVGIDVSKTSLDVHVLPEGVAFQVARNAAGLDEAPRLIELRTLRLGAGALERAEHCSMVQRA